jgi:hypothetical protein
MQLLKMNKSPSPHKKPESPDTPPMDPKELQEEKRRFEEQILMLNQSIKRLAGTNDKSPSSSP